MRSDTKNGFAKAKFRRAGGFEGAVVGKRWRLSTPMRQLAAAVFLLVLKLLFVQALQRDHNVRPRTSLHRHFILSAFRWGELCGRIHTT